MSDPPPSSEEPTASAGPLTDAFGRAIVETVRTPLLVLDQDHRIVATNPAFRQRLADEPAELDSRSFFEIDGGRWDFAALRSRLEEVPIEEEEIRDLEVRVDVGGETPRSLLVDARRIRLEGEGAELILLSFEDVTEHALYEERLETYARELERSNRELESFAHAASHDLQEPLRKIRTYVDRITSTVDADTLDERVRRYLERLPEAVERMQTRIDDLLQLARLGREQPDRRPTDLGDVVKAVLEDLEVTLAESGARVDVGELPTVDADPSQMRLLFQNLIANAVKFARTGQSPVVRVRAAPDGGEGSARSEGGLGGPQAAGPPDERHRIVVEDEGIGFEEQYAERVFEPFQRLHGRAVFEGSGVGLAVCRRVVAAHGGTITAEGRPDVGARFVITLPATTTEERAP